MFTGIIESLGLIKRLKKEQKNLHITVESHFTSELKIDQSVAHNGVCLTVVNISGNEYTVTAIDETLQKTNIGRLEVNDLVNLERARKIGDRLDGHIVQGHVDTTGRCINIEDSNGSHWFTFEFDPSSPEFITVEKGSVCINGISLTVVNSSKGKFSVAIIPYTLEHTNLKNVQVGNEVNLEFDIIGKYLTSLAQPYQ